MALSAGTRLGPYEIGSLLGVGGMGEVYRARDMKLDRDVAIKVLPESFAADPERVARFEREAKTLASLNHPNIGQIYGLEDAAPSAGSGRAAVKALVLELVEGPTLADRIARGAIPMDEALPVAKQIADALEAAHEHAIVHRDLKPANIKVRDDGTVKVLDFGLAKALDPAPTAIDVSQSPTLSVAATRMGVILGTAAYMAPEQAKGKPVDKRADIWAFGCVLYEMLTGTRAFAGDDVSDTLAAILKEEPDWTRLPERLPGTVAAVLRRCLQKDIRARLRDIGDAHWHFADADAAATAPPPTRGAGLWSHQPRRLVVASMVAVGVGGMIGWAARMPLLGVSGTAGVVSRTSIALPAEAPFVVQAYPGACLALSPDGSLIVDDVGAAAPAPQLAVSSNGTLTQSIATLCDRTHSCRPIAAGQRPRSQHSRSLDRPCRSRRMEPASGLRAAKVRWFGCRSSI